MMQEQVDHEVQENPGFTFTRREGIIGAAALLAGGAFAGSKLGSDSSRQDGNPAYVPVEQGGAAEQPHEESLNINIATLPRGENLLLPEQISPETVKAVHESGDREEFMRIFLVLKKDTLTDGKIDYKKGALAFAHNLDTAMRIACDEESLGEFINDPTPDRYVNASAGLWDVNVTRALSGVGEAETTDAQIKESALYREYSAAVAAARRRFFHNAQREHGNLNEAISVQLLDSTFTEKDERSWGDRYRVIIHLALTNTTTIAPPPVDKLHIEGKMPITLDWAEGFDNVAFSRTATGDINAPLVQLSQKY